MFYTDCSSLLLYVLDPEFWPQFFEPLCLLSIDLSQVDCYLGPKVILRIARLEVLQDCFVEFLIYRLSCRDELMMNQPVNVEERNQHGLDIGLYLPRFLRSRR